MAPGYEERKENVMRCIKIAAFMPIVKYAGLMTGIAGVADDMDPWKIGIGGAAYAFASAYQYATELCGIAFHREAAERRIKKSIDDIVKKEQ